MIGLYGNITTASQTGGLAQAAMLKGNAIDFHKYLIISNRTKQRYALYVMQSAGVL